MRDGSNELNEDGFGFLEEDVVLGDVVVGHELSGDVLDGSFPTREDGEVDGSVFLSGDLDGSGTEFGEAETKVVFVGGSLREVGRGGREGRKGREEGEKRSDEQVEVSSIRTSPCSTKEVECHSREYRYA